jgi:polyisoprenoid-binding protein YceI
MLSLRPLEGATFVAADGGAMNVRAIIIAATAAFALTGMAVAADSTWKVDPVHSSASFTAVHLGISRVTGTIPIKSASLVIPDGSNIPTSVQAVLDPSGIDTHTQMRDDDLRSGHFFDVKAYPVMSFTSTSITATDDKHISIDGNLTMHGVTKPITLAAAFLGRGPGMKGEPHAAYTATTTVDRTQWGMTYGYPVVSNSIDLVINVEAAKQ